jgi:hypothetical protein
MMKFLYAIAFLAFTPFGFAQQKNPVSWKASYTLKSATEGEITITGTIEKGWHTYSQRLTDAGPINTSFTFTPMKSYKLEGSIEDRGAHEEFDPAFDAKIFLFNDKAEFSQKIRLTGKGGFTLPFKVEYVCCNSSMCLPPNVVEVKVKIP